MTVAKVFAGVMFGMLAAATVKPVIDYGSRRLAIRILNARAQYLAERRAEWGR